MKPNPTVSQVHLGSFEGQVRRANFDGRGTSDGVAARGFVKRGPRLRRGRGSTDRCVPDRTPSTADPKRVYLLQSQKKSKGPKSPTQRSGALNYPCFYKTKCQRQKDSVFFRYWQFRDLEKSVLHYRMGILRTETRFLFSDRNFSSETKTIDG